jgi:hypothetical protein
MMAYKLVGSKTIILRNDFIVDDQSAVIFTIDSTTNEILLKLDRSFKYKGTTYSHVVASPRLSRDDLGTLENHGILGCSLTWVPDTKFNIQNPMNLSWWRGGAAAISDLRIDYP